MFDVCVDIECIYVLHSDMNLVMLFSVLYSLLLAPKCWGHSSQVHKGSSIIVFH